MIQSMLKTHADALVSSNVGFHEFLLVFRRESKEVYGFVEGKDDPCFYQTVIEHRIPSGWCVKLIPCRSKNNVLGVFTLFDWTRFERGRVCFFVDRDLSELTGGTQSDPSLYVTDDYSIENAMVNRNSMVRVLQEVMGVVAASDQELEFIGNEFDRLLADYCALWREPMAQIVDWRSRRVAANLNNFSPKQCFDLTSGPLTVVTKSSVVDALSSAVGASRGAQLDVQRCADMIDAQGGISHFVRGKYLLWFFVSFVRLVHEYVFLYCKAHTKPPRERFGLSEANVVAVLGPRARAPASLVAFLSANYEKYILAC